MCVQVVYHNKRHTTSLHYGYVCHSERGKKTSQTEEEVGRQHQRMNRPGVRQVPEGTGEQGKMETTGCEIICGAPTTLAVKGYMMMMTNGLRSYK